jgi:hypothetical protein
MSGTRRSSAVPAQTDGMIRWGCNLRLCSTP